jgi:aspartate racemase
MHKKIGIIGGLSPESTISYYLHITRKYAREFGDCNYPEIIIYSVNLEKYHQWRMHNQWDAISDDLIRAANNLKKAGADFGLIATNTMHKVFDQVQKEIALPLIDLLEVTALEAKKQNLKKLGLLGTINTMSDGFYQRRLAQFGLTTIVPNEADQSIVHNIIVDELVLGRFLKPSKSQYLRIIEQLAREGANGIILGCTEIPLLIHQQDCALPLLDTAQIHADAAYGKAIAQQITKTI